MCDSFLLASVLLSLCCGSIKTRCVFALWADRRHEPAQDLVTLTRAASAPTRRLLSKNCARAKCLQLCTKVGVDAEPAATSIPRYV